VPRITAGFTALMALLALGVFALPAWAGPIWAAIGLLAVGAVVLGVHRNAPRRRLPWLLLAGAILAMAAGDTIYGFTTPGPSQTAPIVADVLYLAMFPLLTAGLILLTRASIVLRDRSRLLDLLIFTCGALLVCWVLAVNPSLGAPGLGSLDRSALAAYALGGLLVLVTSVRLVITAPGSRAVLLLAVGAAGALVADLTYALSLVGDGWRPGNAGELGYLVFYACWGLAALQPSMAELTAPVNPRPSELRGGWAVLLGLSLLVPPGVLLAESMAGRVRDGIVIAVASMVMLALVVTRLVDAIERHRRSVGRERVLREACGALVAATDAAAVGAAVRTAVGRLVPPGVEYRVVFAASHTDGVLTAGVSVWGPAMPSPYPLPSVALARRTRLLRAHALHPALREELGDFTATLVCPLILDDRSTGDSRLGALFVAAHERVLAALQDAVEVLAAQATLALERITLTDEVNRRDGDQYVRTVVQNTADVVLIADEEQRIRYASPSLATLLGVAAPAFGTLRDVVHPDDVAQVERTLEQARAARDGKGVRGDWTLRGPDGDRVLVEVICRDLRRDRMVRGFVVTMRDAAVRRAQEQEAIRRALEDSSAGQNRRSALNKFT
jgi:PAS domain S-box-containing protein